jgi:hypothetical protein
MTEDELDSATLDDPQQGQAIAEEADLAYQDLEQEDRPAIDVEEPPAPEPAVRRRRGCMWWLVAVGLSILALIAIFGLVGLLLFNFGTMEAPSAQIQADYDQLVARRQIPAEAKSPGFRIPIPGCRCHAADADIGQKMPGRQPDVALVIAHRYRTISQCSQCHGSEKEPAGIEGQRLEDSPPQ